MSKSQTRIFFLFLYIFAGQLRAYYHIWLTKIILSCLKWHLNLYTDLFVDLHYILIWDYINIFKIQIYLLLHCVKYCTPSKMFILFLIDIHIQLLLISPLLVKSGGQSTLCKIGFPLWGKHKGQNGKKSNKCELVYSLYCCPSVGHSIRAWFFRIFIRFCE